MATTHPESPAIDVRPISGTAEWDAAAELIAVDLWHNPAAFEQLAERYRGHQMITTPEDIAYAKKQIAELDELQMGAFDETGRLLAVAGVKNSHRLKPGDRAQLVDVVTAYDSRRRGVGKAVMGAVENWAKQRKLQGLWVAASTSVGGKLYESLGYTWNDDSRTYRKDL
jgi:GNAT superfamily N-acetyltransferase